MQSRPFAYAEPTSLESSRGSSACAPAIEMSSEAVVGAFLEATADDDEAEDEDEAEAGDAAAEAPATVEVETESRVDLSEEA